MRPSKRVSLLPTGISASHLEKGCTTNTGDSIQHKNYCWNYGVKEHRKITICYSDICYIAAKLKLHVIPT